MPAVRGRYSPLTGWRVAPRPPLNQSLKRPENTGVDKKSNVHSEFSEVYMSMVLRIKPTASPSISKASPGSTMMVW